MYLIKFKEKCKDINKKMADLLIFKFLKAKNKKMYRRDFYLRFNLRKRVHCYSKIYQKVNKRLFNVLME